MDNVETAPIKIGKGYAPKSTRNWVRAMFLAFWGLAGGCTFAVDSPPSPPPEGLEAQETQALKIVWHDVYGMPWHDGDTWETYGGPAVIWHYGDTCGGSPGFKSPDGTGYGPDDCDWGEYHSSDLTFQDTSSPFVHGNAADIEWGTRGTSLFSDTCLAHELGHARQQYLTGDLDSDHSGAPFNGQSTCFSDNDSTSLVAQARAALQAEGL